MCYHLKIYLNYNIAFYFQTNEQIERRNQILSIKQFCLLWQIVIFCEKSIVVANYLFNAQNFLNVFHNQYSEKSHVDTIRKKRKFFEFETNTSHKTRKKSVDFKKKLYKKYIKFRNYFKYQNFFISFILKVKTKQMNN